MVPTGAVGVQRSGIKRWAEWLTAIWKQTPVAVLEKASSRMMRMSIPLQRLRSTSERSKTASRPPGHVLKQYTILSKSCPCESLQPETTQGCMQVISSGDKLLCKAAHAPLPNQFIGTDTQFRYLHTVSMTKHVTEMEYVITAWV